MLDYTVFFNVPPAENPELSFRMACALTFTIVHFTADYAYSQ